MTKFSVKFWVSVGLTALWLGAGCSSDADPMARGGASHGQSGEDESVDEGPSPVVKKDAGNTRDKDAGTAKPSESAVIAGKDAGAPAEAALKSRLPCDVQTLVSSKCGACHGAETTGGAPMSLSVLSDFHAPARTDGARQVHALALERMTESDPTRRMPPASVDITPAETTTLTQWLKGGAEGSSEKCAVTTAEPGPAVGGKTPANAHSGGVSIKPLAYADPNVKCYKFLGFSKTGDRTKKYDVPTTPDYYVAFNIKPEFKGTQYLKSFEPIIDNAPVLHHWLFYKQTTAGANSVLENAIGAHPDGDLLAGWAPGGDPMYMDEDTGIEVSGDVSYQIEMHYNNKTGAVTQDASGLEMCVTTTKPTHVAAVAWLGTDSISGTSSTGNCKPSTTEPVHLIAGSPHMHLKGRHMKVVVTRKDGKQEIIHDKDFDFQYQRQYIEDWVINPGDSVQTTCTFSDPSRFGKGTNDEMCYFFSTHWPAGGLSMLGSGTIIHGGNSCLP